VIACYKLQNEALAGHVDIDFMQQSSLGVFVISFPNSREAKVYHSVLVRNKVVLPFILKKKKKT